MNPCRSFPPRAITLLLAIAVVLWSSSFALAGDTITLTSRTTTLQLCSEGRTLCSVMTSPTNRGGGTGKNFLVRNPATGAWPPLFAITFQQTPLSKRVTLNSTACLHMEFGDNVLSCVGFGSGNSNSRATRVTVGVTTSFRSQFIEFGPITVVGNLSTVVSVSLPFDATTVPTCGNNRHHQQQQKQQNIIVDAQESEYDALVFPASSGVVLPQPALWPVRESFTYPGHAALQFMTRQCAAAAAAAPSSQSSKNNNNGGGSGLYIATHDIAAHVKNFQFRAVPKQYVALSVEHLVDTFSPPSVVINYTIAMTVVQEMTSWHDAANVYRGWVTAAATKAPWVSQGTLVERSDVPDFLKDGKGVTGAIWSVSSPRGFNPTPLGAQLEKLPALVASIKRQANVSHFIAPVYGWEHLGTWAGINYFPPRPSAGAWLNVSQQLSRTGDAVALLVSGYWWVIKRKQTSGGPAFDNSSEIPILKGMLIKNATGNQLFEVNAYDAPTGRQSWRGLSAKMCMGHPNSTKTMTDIFLKIANSLKVPIVSFDQTIGGSQVEPCYDPTHPHPPGQGSWSWSSGFKKALEGIRAGAKNKQQVVMMEQCSEHAIPYTGTYWSRQFAVSNFPFGRARAKGMFSFIYHEFTTALAAALVQGVESNSEFMKIKAMANSVARGLILCPFEFHLNDKNYKEAYYSFSKSFGQYGAFLVNGRAEKPPAVVACDTVSVPLAHRNMTFCATSVGTFSSPPVNNQQHGSGVSKTFVASAVPYPTHVVLMMSNGTAKNVTISESFGVVVL